MRIKIIAFMILFISLSCSNKNHAYFSDSKELAESESKILNQTELKIKTDDLLIIAVSSLSNDANVLFNNSAAQQISTISNQGANSRAGESVYLVDPAGYIDFPVLGKIKLAGLSKQEAKDKLLGELQGFIKQPTVAIRFQNFRVTVVGEVARPSSFVVPSERINIIEALGMAGDMTNYGKRDNVLIIREADGVRKMARINLNKKETMNSPYFYLQQNDVVYVEPNNSKVSQSTIDTRFISLGFAAISTISLILWRFF